MAGEKRRDFRTGIGIGIVLATVVVLIMVLPYVMPVHRTRQEILCELGGTLEQDIHAYVKGPAPAVDKARLDTSAVDTGRVGEYRALVTHGFRQLEYTVLVQDTTSPVLDLGMEMPVLEAGSAVTAKDLGITARDYSGEVVVSLGIFEDNTEVKAEDFKEKLVPQEAGYRTLWVCATDTSGNSVTDSLTVLVDEAPEILGVQPFYISVGSDADYSELITCVDTTDGDLTGDLTVDSSKVDPDTPGSYEVVYMCRDSYGLEARETAAVTVMEPMDLQEAINSHSINRLEHRIIGALNLYDSGVCEREDIIYAMEAIEPAVVGISIKSGYWGSGFIIEINDEEMIICTNEHVIKDYASGDVYFHDGTVLRGEVAARNEGQDMGFVTVDMDKVPGELLDTLKTVHINKGYWQTLANDSETELGLRTINKDGSVWRDRKGKLVKKATQLEEGTTYREVETVTEVTIQLFKGCSGSAIVDGYGNLIAMAAAHGEGRYYGIYLENILNFFYKTFGRDVNYY